MCRNREIKSGKNTMLFRFVTKTADLVSSIDLSLFCYVSELAGKIWFVLAVQSEPMNPETLEQLWWTRFNEVRCSSSQIHGYTMCAITVLLLYHYKTIHLLDLTGIASVLCTNKRFKYNANKHFEKVCCE